MRQTAEWLTREQLVKKLKDSGYRGITDAQVRRWHKNGFVTRPRVRHLGRPTGNVSEYPAHALVEAGAVAMLLKGRRSFRHLNWYLWCLGFPRTPEARAVLRARLTDEIAQTSADLKAFERGDCGSQIGRAAVARLSQGFGRARRRVGAGGIVTIQAMVNELRLGDAGRLAKRTPDDWRTFVIGMLAVQNPTTPVSSETLRKEMPGVRRVVALLLSENSLAKTLAALDRASDRVLVQVRDAVQTLTRAFERLPEDQDVLVSPDAYLAYFKIRIPRSALARATGSWLRNAASRGEIPWPRPSVLYRSLRAAGKLPKKGAKHGN